MHSCAGGSEGFECFGVKRTRLRTHSTASAVDHTRQSRFTLKMAGGDKSLHRMARPPFRHIHRAGAWTNTNHHSLGGCSLQLAVTAAVCTVCRRQVKCVCQWWSESGAPSHGLQVRPTLCMPCAQRHFPSPCVRNPLEEIANSAPSAQAMACVVKDTFFF